MSVPYRILRLWVGGVAALICGLAAGCTSAPQGQPETSVPEPIFERPAWPAKPNIIFLSMDALRRDHLHCMGYPRPTSPNVDRLARDAMIFPQAIAHATCTFPSIGVMMLGVYQWRSGAYGNGDKISRDILTLPEFLQSQGYYTSCIQSNAMLRKGSGIAQGYDYYDDEMPQKEFVRNQFQKKPIDTGAAYFKWLAQRPKDKPTFLWVHFIDPHGPYVPPPHFETAFKEDIWYRMFDHKLRMSVIPEYQTIGQEDSFEFYTSRYDGEIRDSDYYVGQILASLKEQGLYDNSLILFFADHGESLGESGYFRHGDHDVEAQTSIPFILKFPGNTFAGKYFDKRIGLIDVYPTLVNLLGAPIDQPMEGFDLMPYILGTEMPDRVMVCRSCNKEPAIAVYREHWKYSVDMRPMGHKRLFDLDQDPGAVVDTSAKQALVFNRLEAALSDIISGHPVEAEERDVSREDLEIMRALGYIQ